jgi:hypothetical protein
MSLGPYDLERGVRPKRVLKAIKELDNDLRDIIKITDPIDLDYDGKTLSGGEIDEVIREYKHAGWSEVTHRYEQDTTYTLGASDDAEIFNSIFTFTK